MNTIDNSTEKSSSVNLVNSSRIPLALAATSNSNIKTAQSPIQNRNAKKGRLCDTVYSCNIWSNTNVDLLAAMTTRGCPPNSGASKLAIQEASKLSRTP